MKACASCPARLIADLLAALGSAERAAEIRANGCSWWWSIQEENSETGQVRTVERCGAEALPHFLRSYGMDLARAANMVRDDHEGVLRAVGGLAAVVVGRPALAEGERVELLLGDGGANVHSGG